MRFKHTTPDEQFFLKFVSEEGLWELGLYRVMFGVRIRLCQGFSCSLDYCAGDDIIFAIQLLLLCARILGDLPESIRQGRLEKLFPHNMIKPMNLDPACLQQLEALADAASEWDRNLDMDLVDCLEAASQSPKLYNPFSELLPEES